MNREDSTDTKHDTEDDSSTEHANNMNYKL